MKNNKLISIIMPNYNTDNYIEEAIISVLHQTYDNWELLIIDDNSTDRSICIINSYAKQDYRIKVIQLNKKHDVYCIRNIGIKLAKGDFIAFLDSDDIWLNNKLEKSVLFALSNNYDFIYTSYKRYNDKLEPILYDYIVPLKVSFYDILYTNPISTPTVLINISKIGKYYQPNIYKREDYGLWLNILKNIKYAYGLNESLTIYRIRKNSLSRNKIQVIKYQFYVYKFFLNMNIISSIYYLLYWIIASLKKYEKI
jgi:glycosyltransferase involved in cell wall biosynthesis